MTGLTNTTRLHNLDYLRGLAAFSIMIYHYSSWSMGRFDAGDVLGRIGIYGVSVFYVLSGLTLYHVYYHDMVDLKDDLSGFYVKRFFRIFPLLWLTILMDSILRLNMPDWYTLFLNVTGLFGVLKWDAYIGTGVWSIGNELTFYLFFPVFVLLARKNRIGFFVFALIVFSLYLYFAYIKLPPYATFKDDGWYHYINPLNQVFLFLGGFLIGLLFEKKNISNVVIACLALVSVVAFVFYPVDGERIHLVQGHTRMAFTLICFVTCFCFYKWTRAMPGWFDRPMSKLGEYSYSLYLLHPLVWYFSGYVALVLPLNPAVKFVACVVVTLVVSKLVFVYYEKPFMSKGKAWFQKYVHRQATR